MTESSIRIAIVGTGYVGLVQGAGLAHLGFDVTCIDKDPKRIDDLKNGIIPIYEEGLEELVKSDIERGLLHFTCDLPATVARSDVVFIAVGTPGKKSGEADLSLLDTALSQIISNINKRTTIVIKSTVPVGTAARLRNMFSSDNGSGPPFDIVSNPEFLRQGTAVNDFLRPERVVVGADSQRAIEKMREIYGPLAESGVRIIETTNETAELCKYAANGFLAAKIAFVNEIANMCDLFGADVSKVTESVGLDSRIGSTYLKPGPGFGGSCLLKDVKALMRTAKHAKYDFKLGKAIVSANKYRMDITVKTAKKMLKSIKGTRIGVLGLAFKAGTDDTRDSPAMHIVRSLYERGARIVAYDPVAMPAARRELPDIEYVDSPYDVCLSADLLMVLTEWPQFNDLDFLRIREMLAKPMILDARNMLEVALMDELGIMYVDNGRRSLAMAERLAVQRQASHEHALSEHKQMKKRSARCPTALLLES